MTALQGTGGEVAVHVENVGGIDETEVALRPGTNVLVGSNATNRTSLLQAIMAGLGSERVSLKGDAERGHVELRVGDETHRRTIRREDGEEVFDGDPYTDETLLADLFAFLLESNEARRAVVRGDDLREIIMRPLDTDAIEARIDDLRSRKRDLEAELDRRGTLEERRDALETECDDLRDRIDETAADLEAKRAEIEAADADPGANGDTAEVESALEELRERRSALEDVRYRLETERESADRLEEELSAVRDELADLPEAPTDELAELEERTATLHERKRTLDSRINELQTLIQFNEEFLESETFEAMPGLDDGEDPDHPTGRLVPGESSLTCWTCGAETTRGDVGEILDRLREHRRELADRRNRISTELDETTERKSRLDDQRARRTDLERRETDLAAELEETEGEIESLVERESALVAEVEALDDEVDERRAAEDDEVVELHREANALEFELQQRETELDRTAADLASVEDELDALSDVEADLADVRSRLDEERTRIERVEREAVETFNEHMAAVLDVLAYDGIERIWIERTERDVRDGRRTVSRGFFDLHVVRESDDGAVYEDTVAHLSESEREVTGLVFALAGYLAHDVYEAVPFVLLDSVEAIDAGRIPDFLDYLADYADYLVVALLPEDAAGIGDDARRITEI